MNQAIVVSRGELYNSIIDAHDIQRGLVPDKGLYFVDPEYRFRVVFKHRGKNGKAEHFALYLSKEDWNRLEKEYDNETRRIILSRLKHIDESQWHKHWKEVFRFAELEKFIKNSETGKHRRPDVFLNEQKTCLEFQHSFSDKTFVERSQFFDDLGLNVIWLFDLTDIDVVAKGDNVYVIPEDNLKGFFNVAFHPENLYNYAILFQARDENIYLIDAPEHLGKYEIPHRGIITELNSSVRLFRPLKVYSEESFIQAIVSGDLNLKSLAYLKATDQYDTEVYARKRARLLQLKEIEDREKQKQELCRKQEQERIAYERAEKEKRERLLKESLEFSSEQEKQLHIGQAIFPKTTGISCNNTPKESENTTLSYKVPESVFEKPNSVVIDDGRIYTCKYCGHQGPEADFVSYGGPDGTLIGVCRDSECREKQYQESILKSSKNIKSKPQCIDQTCPKCGAKLVKRTGRFGPFWGCSNYPNCKYTIKRN